jgi:hypothetical protein
MAFKSLLKPIFFLIAVQKRAQHTYLVFSGLPKIWFARIKVRSQIANDEIKKKKKIAIVLMCD